MATKHPFTILELARLYKAKKAKKSAIEAKAKAAKKKLDDDLEILARLMDVYISEAEHETGKTSIPTKYGTVYRQEKTKFVLANTDQFIDFFISEPEMAFRLLTNALSSTEVKEYVANQRAKLEEADPDGSEEVDEDTLLPPGVEARRFNEVVVRSS